MGIQVMSTNVILILILIGYIDGRRDMYVDIAISYAMLGFIGAVIVAKFLGSRCREEEPEEGPGVGPEKGPERVSREGEHHGN
jgi:hypothetical protein